MYEPNFGQLEDKMISLILLGFLPCIALSVPAGNHTEGDTRMAGSGECTKEGTMIEGTRMLDVGQKAEDIEVCKQRCLNNPLCIAISYVRDHRKEKFIQTCFLWSAVTGGNKRAGVASSRVPCPV